MPFLFDKPYLLTHWVWKKIHPTRLSYNTIFHPPCLFKSPRLIFWNNCLPTTFIQDPTFIRDIRVSKLDLISAQGWISAQDGKSTIMLIRSNRHKRYHCNGTIWSKKVQLTFKNGSFFRCSLHLRKTERSNGFFSKK